MGDRANIAIRDEWPDDLGSKEAVFLYTHWNGTELPAVLARALDRGRGRWSDTTYLARVVFSEMVRGDIDGETGFGISTRLTDNEYDLLVLHKERVYLLSEAAYIAHGFAGIDRAPGVDGIPSFSFEEFAALGDAATWNHLLNLLGVVRAT